MPRRAERTRQTAVAAAFRNRVMCQLQSYAQTMVMSYGVIFIYRLHSTRSMPLKQQVMINLQQ